MQAGIELVENVQVLNQQLYRDHGIELNVRVGIHTGLVVIGDLTGSSQNSLALGTTPNIAARIQDYAKPNSVIISENTYQLIQHLFKCKKLGKQQFKGFSISINVYQAYQSLHISPWLAICENHSMIPLIGREQESSLLTNRLDQAISGTGQAVLLSGEAGIGKSRLTQYVREHISNIPHQLLECWGTQQFQNSYLHCIINVLRQIWELDRLPERSQQLQAIESALSSLDIPTQESVPLIAELLSIPLESSQYIPSKSLPQQKKTQTLDILLSLTNNLSANGTLVLIAEDLHWIDPTTLELLGLIIDQVPTSKIFLLLTSRLKFKPPWQARSHITQISINKLTRKQSGKMIDWITDNKKLPMELYQQIIDKTDGIPFFVEELTQMVLKSNVLTLDGDRYKLKNSLVPLEIPATLQDSLMARLDELGPEKELAQISAIVGREFRHEVLQAVLKKQRGSSSELSMDHLSILVCSEFLYRKGLPPHASYMFRHALVHEAAYQSLLFKTRHKYHRQIAEILTQNFPNIVNENPEIIAHHYANGGDHVTAIKYWIIAGDTALRRSALVDAIIHLSNGLRCIKKINTPNPQKLSHELVIQAKLAKAYVMIRGYGDSAVQKCFSRAYEISKEISSSDLSLPILHGLWEYSVVRADLTTATEIAERMDKFPGVTQHSEWAIETKRMIGATLFWKGELSDAKPYLLQGLSKKYSPFNREDCGTTQDPRVAGLSNLACLLWLTGFADQALKIASEAVDLANKLEHPFSQAYAHLFRAVILHLRGDVPALVIETNKLISISNQFNFLFWQTTAAMLQSWSRHKQSPSNSDISKFENALKQYHATGSRLALCYFQSMLADLYFVDRRYEQALQLLEIAITDAKSRGDLFFLPELIRIKANTLHALHRNNTQTIELLDEANTVAEQQGANAVQLRIAITRHDLINESSQPKSKTYSQIRSLLSDISEGQECIDIVTAKRITQLENGVTHAS